MEQEVLRRKNKYSADIHKKNFADIHKKSVSHVYKLGAAEQTTICHSDDGDFCYLPIAALKAGKGGKYLQSMK